jgi:hypothetical protein
VVGDFIHLLQTDNLPVKIAAGRSRHAAQNDHERLAALPGPFLALFEVRQPTVAGRFLIPAPVPPSLSQHRAICQGRQPQSEQDKEVSSHAKFSNQQRTEGIRRISGKVRLDAAFVIRPLAGGTGYLLI